MERRLRMTFATRVARLTSKLPDLSEVDQSGDPAIVAAEHVELASVKDFQQITAPRASKLYSACMRQYVLGTINGTERVQWVNFASKITFGIGRAVHYWLQNTPDIFGARRVGWWRCMACGKILYFGFPPKAKCSECGARKQAIIYHEHYLRITSPVSVTGHTDLFLQRKPGMYRVVEIKTMSKARFDPLIAPLIEDEWQLQTYMNFCSKPEGKIPVEIDPSVGYLLYVSKGHYRDKLPLKMFPVERSDDIIRQVNTKLKLYKDGLETYPDEVPPLHRDCRTKGMGCWTAKSCPTLNECKEVIRASE
jgi:uncharacterized OB-fold protein